ncbi:MAG: hypothetical protein H7Y20_00575 [Bryobacteraceae bacterium]|nr:hypothetical protein [Bryobacteraceae bacterium]
MKSLEFRPAALEFIRDLPAEDHKRIGYASHQYKQSGIGDVKKLKDAHEQFRLRVGDWRIRFGKETPETIIIHDVSRCDKAYTD